MVRKKTDCINTFIKKLEKWVNNYEVKQEFLGNLRKEFVVNS